MKKSKLEFEVRAYKTADSYTVNSRHHTLEAAKEAAALCQRQINKHPLTAELFSRIEIVGEVKFGKAQLLKELKALHGMADREVAKIRAEELLLKFINDKDISAAYAKVPKW